MTIRSVSISVNKYLEQSLEIIKRKKKKKKGVYIDATSFYKLRGK